MLTKTIRLAILCSGSGTNAENIIRYFQGHTAIATAVVLANKPEAYALTRARNLGVPTEVFSKADFNTETSIIPLLALYNVTHIVLAGFLLLVPETLIKAFPDKIVNIHPALLPKFGGKGMYGLNVHQAVKDKAETETGITIHLVNQQYDKGEILFQATTKLEKLDTVEEIAHKVQQLEYQYFPKVIEAWIMGNKLPID